MDLFHSSVLDFIYIFKYPWTTFTVLYREPQMSVYFFKKSVQFSQNDLWSPQKFTIHISCCREHNWPMATAATVWIHLFPRLPQLVTEPCSPHSCTAASGTGQNSFNWPLWFQGSPLAWPNFLRTILWSETLPLQSFFPSLLHVYVVWRLPRLFRLPPL